MCGITVEEIFTEGDNRNNPVEYGKEERKESGVTYSTVSSGF